MTQAFDQPVLNHKAIEESLIIHLDDLDNIVTTAVSGDYPPTGHAYVRDATNALPLAERLQPDNPYLQGINLLLRANSIIGAIEHTIQYKKAGDPDNIIYDESIARLNELLQTLAGKLLKDPDKKKNFNELEKDIFTDILPLLNRAGLSKGLATPKDYANLLDHYRGLASLLAPAKAYVTKLNHTVGGMTVQHIETAHPITKKTDVQKAQIASLKNTADNADVNFHTGNLMAFRQASAAFADLLAHDDTCLPAQARRNIGVTVKNGFVVHNEIIFPGNEHVEFWGMRTATMSYIGDGETDEARIVTYAQENLKQLREAAQSIAKRNDMQITMLLTDHFWNQQDQMIRVTKAAGESDNVPVSVLSTNWFGTFDPLDLHPKAVQLALHVDQGLPNISSEAANRATRMGKVGDFIVAIGANPKIPDMIMMVCCASGQDRTGTAMEVAVMKWIDQEYKTKSLTDVNYTTAPGEIEKMRALGGHNSMLATLVAPGSAGLKSDSTPDKYFSELTTRYTYRATADTNKNPLIDKKRVIGLLPPASGQGLINPAILKSHYEYNSNQIMSATSEREIKAALASWAEIAIAYQTGKEASAGTMAHIGRWMSKGTSPEEGIAIREMVLEAARALKENATSAENFSLTKILKDIRLCITELKNEVPDMKQRGTVFEELNVLVNQASQQLEAIKNNPQQESALRAK